jgi:uncharacterized membrane protein (DUF4010 family)
MNYYLLQGFLIALAIGALIGAQREREKIDRVNIGGFRTYILVSLLGALTALLMAFTGQGWMFAVIFASMAALTVATYIFMAGKNSLGVITEYLIFLTFILGFFAMTEQYRWLAIIISVVLLMVTEFGRVIDKFLKSLSREEWVDSLRFLAVVFLIYPILPKVPVDPWGLINPSEIWLLVILISSIQFIGYYLIKSFGSSKGIILNAIMGGLVSSTATTSSMSIMSNKAGKNVNQFVIGVMLANIAKVARIVVILWIVAPTLVMSILPYLLVFVVAVAAISTYWYMLDKNDEDVKGDDIDLGFWSPFQFLPALKMALLFTGIKIFAQVGLDSFGSSGIVLTTAISSFVDVDAIVLSIGGLFANSTLGLRLTIQLVLLAIISNSVLKSIITQVQGSKEFARKSALSFAVLIMITITTVLSSVFFVK